MHSRVWSMDPNLILLALLRPPLEPKGVIRLVDLAGKVVLVTVTRLVALSRRVDFLILHRDIEGLQQ